MIHFEFNRKPVSIMKKQSRTILFLMTAAAAVLLLLLLSACGETPAEVGTDTPASPTETTAAAQTNEAATEPSRENTPDSLPELDFNGRDVSVLYRLVSNLPDYEIYAEQTGDIIDDAVFNRNLKVSERLNVNFKFSGQGKAAADALPTAVVSSVLAGEAMYDFWVWGQANILKAATQDLLADLSGMKYIDLDAVWWNSDYIDTMRIGPNHLYFLTGDLLTTVISRMSTLFLNKALYNDLYGDANALCEDVFDGKFTYDGFGKLVEGAYADLNGDGARDLDDRYGVMTTLISNTDHFAFTAGLSLGKRKADGTTVLDVMNENNIAVFEAVNDLYFNNVGFITTEGNEIVDGRAENRFASNQMLFLPLWFAATERLRSMDADYLMLPYPKLNEKQENYKALVQNTASVIAVPKTAGDLDLVGAVLEAMAAENYRTVIPVYYETGLKTKYSRDDVSSQMVDLIYSVATSDFFYAYSSSLGSVGTIARAVVGQQQDFASYWASKESEVKTALDALIALDAE